MRFFIKLVLAMVLFNAFIFLLTPFFPNQEMISGNAVNVTSEYGSSYNANIGLDSIILNIFTDPSVLIVFSAIFSIGLVVSLALSGSHNVPLSIGISIIIALIASLYMGTMRIFNSLCDDYSLVYALLSIMTLIIGIYFIFSISDMFAGRSDT